MTIVELLLLLLIAGLCGTMSQMLSGYSHGGCLVAIVLGFVGTLLGSYLARLTGLPDVFTIDVGGRAFSRRLVDRWRCRVFGNTGAGDASPYDR